MDKPVCAVIVTYNCGEKVIPAARSVRSQVNRILFVDNGSRDATGGVLEKVRKESPDLVEILTIESNRGIAGALNLGVRRAVELGFHWVLTMDHDSEADRFMVEKLLQAALRHTEPRKVLLCAPIYVDRNSGEAGRMYRYDGWKRFRLAPVHDGEVLFPSVVITSGNLLNVENYLAAGGFDESLFIDYVDHDYCLRGVRAGLHILVPADARLFHSVGDAVSKSLLGFRIFSTNHPPERRYTIGRNRMTVIRRYGRDFPAYAVCTALDYGIDVMGIVLCEKERRKKLRMIFRGMRESWKRKEAPFDVKGVAP